MIINIYDLFLNLNNIEESDAFEFYVIIKFNECVKEILYIVIFNESSLELK